MPTLVDAQALRAQLVALTGLAADDLKVLWRGWPWDDPGRCTELALALIPDVILTYQDMAGGVAADTYDGWRDEEQVPGRFRATPAAVAALDQLSAGIRNAAGSLWQETPDDAAARTLLSGMTTRHVMHGGNDTIVRSAVADPQAAGWSRVVRAGACGFCRMLAGRGGVYRSEKTARFAAHDSCHCAAVVSWDPDAPEVPALAYQASARNQTPGSRARVKAWIEENA